MILPKLKNAFGVITSESETYKYPSITALVNMLAIGKAFPSAQSTMKDSWSGSTDIDEAYQILEGRNNKVDQIATGLASLKGVATELLPQANRFSGRTNVAAMLSGVENCRVRFREQEVEQKMITMYVQVNALADVSPENFINKAIAVANAINNLERSGARVEVIAYSHSRYCGKQSHIEYKVKDFSQTLSLGQLYGSFAPSTFRRLIFRHIELFWTTGTHLDESYGYSNDFEAPKDAINIPRHKSYDTLQGAVNYVNYLIGEYGESN